MKQKKAPFRRKRKHGNCIYPWEEWFRKAQEEPLRLTKGIHYKIDTVTFRQSIRSRATRIGAKVSIHLVHDGEILLTVRMEDVE